MHGRCVQNIQHRIVVVLMAEPRSYRFCICYLELCMRVCVIPVCMFTGKKLSARKNLSTTIKSESIGVNTTIC